jgi:hypothetical protein
MKKAVLHISIAGIWITISEFVRNEFVFKNYWVDHFDALGLTFETQPINGILWLLWSLTLAYLIFMLLRKFSLKETVFLAWLPAFVMMWITIYNLQTLPLKLLFFAIPLSLLEVFVASLIMIKIQKYVRG